MKEFFPRFPGQKPTICVECKHFWGSETESSSALCKAHPMAKRLDLVSGIERPYQSGGFVDREYYYCVDINDGHCPQFEQWSETDV